MPGVPRRRGRVGVVASVALVVLPCLVAAVDRSKFRTCGDTRFCRTYRSTRTPVAPRPAYGVDAASVAVQADGRLTWRLVAPDAPALVGSIAPQSAPRAGVRVRLEEPDSARWEPDDILLPVAAAEADSLSSASLATGATGATWQFADGSRVELTYAPFVVKYYGRADDARPAAVINARGLLHYETGVRSSKMIGSSTTSWDSAAVVEVGAAGETTSADDDQQSGGGACPDGTAWNGRECLEIVGYWEDGLARFADGSKEVKRDESSKTTQPPTEEAAAQQEEEDFSESFGGHRDDVPRGPTSVGVDVSFPGAKAVFGLAEHATKFSLGGTIGANARYAEPYRFYNLDVFEYELDVPMALYGSIPLAWAHDPSSSGSSPRTAGCYWNNPSETFVDVDKSDGDGIALHWISESGVVDVFLMATTASVPTPLKLLASFASLVGAQELPPVFALGYHQCRWNYKDEKDVAFVHGQFEALDIPYDVLWLDIEHTDGKRYFTWDDALFPRPQEMQANLSKTGRKMVTIVDPHIKRDPNYAVHAEATRLRHYIKEAPGSTKDFDGWCWPGSSSYLDFTSPTVRAWWADRFALDKYVGSTEDLYTWNDMNEPSVFNGPEVTMPKTAASLAGVEHREWHNLYGAYFHRATAEGLAQRGRATQRAKAAAIAPPPGTTPPPVQHAGLRPFVLTRSFFAGSQRWGAVWTGDNAARWDHLAIAAPMLLSLSTCGFSFAGADAGGFFGDPEPELMARWIAAAAFTPFFRGHAHHDAKRREPWSFGEPWTQRLRAAIADRYVHLPYWYSTFAKARFAGDPVMRPLWVAFPGDPACLEIDDAWLVGGDLLVKPAVAPGVDAVDVYFPAGSSWVDARPSSSKKTTTWYRGGAVARGIGAGLDAGVPVFQRAGSIVPRQRRLRRSTQAMRTDPYELTVVLDADGRATGDVYLDDQQTVAFATRNAFCWVVLEASAAGVEARRYVGPDLPPGLDRATSDALLAPLRGTDDAAAAEASSSFAVPENRVERLVVFGLDRPPTGVELRVGDATRPLDFAWDAATSKLVVRKPDVVLADPATWTIAFAF